jgi:hypothetical protein
MTGRTGMSWRTEKRPGLHVLSSQTGEFSFNREALEERLEARIACPLVKSW